MNDQTARIQEILFYAQCQLEGMKAENQQRLHRNEAVAYTEHDFLALAEGTRGNFIDALNA